MEEKLGLYHGPKSNILIQHKGIIAITAASVSNCTVILALVTDHWSKTWKCTMGQQQYLIFDGCCLGKRLLQVFL